VENEIFRRLAQERKISAYKHKGEWATMNTLKNFLELNSLWNKSVAFWKVWR